MDTHAFVATGVVRPALRSIAVGCLVVAASLMAMVRPAAGMAWVFNCAGGSHWCYPSQIATYINNTNVWQACPLYMDSVIGYTGAPPNAYCILGGYSLPPGEGGGGGSSGGGGNNCPAGMSGTPCACNAGTVPNASGTCDPEVLTITLSGGSGTEPWHKKLDPNHEKTNLPYKAIVKNQKGQAKANVSVDIATDVTANSGGHDHNSGRPKGKLIAGTPPSTLDGKEKLPGTTDINGEFKFTFGAEEASGEHTIKATCAVCKDPEKKVNVAVEIPGLLQLGADPLGYTLNGYQPWHPGSHYFSAAAIVKIINLAFAISHDPNFNKQLLIINDSSLIKGGVFDLGQDWTYTPNGHQGHRVGVVVDINNFSGPNPQFEDLASTFGIYADWHKKGTAPHYHLWLLGKDQ